MSVVLKYGAPFPHRELDATRRGKPDATRREPPPTGCGRPVLPEVLRDLMLRAEEGTLKYGTLLKTDNGRDALVDAYQEALDLVMYLKQKLMEEEK